MNLTYELKSHFLNLYHLALTDIEFDVLELKMLYQIGEERGLSVAQIQDVVLRPDTIRFSVPETALEKVEFLYDFARIAWADGEIDSCEQKLLRTFCEKFEVEEDKIPALSQFLFEEAEKGTSTEQLLKIVSKYI
ncbi:MAG: hypothetical protein H0V81_07340 [Solirubrobacterales bacterium]|nr:hypothetical protein [Solirubrobacterales bacterium]